MLEAARYNGNPNLRGVFIASNIEKSKLLLLWVMVLNFILIVILGMMKIKDSENLEKGVLT